MDVIKVIGGVGAEIKPVKVDIVEIESQDILNYDSSDENDDDPFSYDNGKDDDPFHLDESDEDNQQVPPKDIKRTKKKIKNTANKTAFDWSQTYRTTQGTPLTKDCTSRIKVIPSSNPHVSASEYTENLNKFHCSHCEISTNTRILVKKHIRMRHRDVPRKYQCPYCPYTSVHPIKSHILSRHTAESEIRWFRCSQCEFKCKFRSGLLKHILYKHTDANQVMDRMKKCEKCPKMYKRSCDLKRHILTVHEKHNIKKIKCSECDYECIHSKHLKNHREIFHSDFENLKTLQCSECNYKTKFERYLRMHTKRNHEDAKYQCDKCAYRTNLPGKIRLHLINHKKVKDDADLKFRCDKCPYKAYRSYSLNVHKLNHLKPEEIQYFYCYHCNFKAKRKDNLKTHVLKHFKRDEVTLACYICEFTTVKRHLLARHIEQHSKEINKTKKLMVSVQTLSDKEPEELKKRVVNSPTRKSLRRTTRSAKS